MPLRSTSLPFSKPICRSIRIRGTVELTVLPLIVGRRKTKFFGTPPNLPGRIWSLKIWWGAEEILLTSTREPKLEAVISRQQLHRKDAMTRPDMSPARLRSQSLKIDVPDGATASRPPTAAVFLTYFDPKAG